MAANRCKASCSFKVLCLFKGIFVLLSDALLSLFHLNKFSNAKIGESSNCSFTVKLIPAGSIAKVCWTQLNVCMCIG